MSGILCRSARCLILCTRSLTNSAQKLSASPRSWFTSWPSVETRSVSSINYRPTSRPPQHTEIFQKIVNVQGELESANDFSALVRVCLKRSKNLNAVQLGMAFNKLAKLYLASSEIQDHNASDYDHDSDKNSSHLTDSASNRQQRSPDQVWLGEAMSRLSGRARNIADLLGPTEITLILHAFAKVSQCPDHKLLVALRRRACETVGDFTPQGVCNTLWAFAKLDIKPDQQFLEAIQTKALHSMSAFNPCDITNFVWAHAVLELPVNRFAPHITRSVEEIIGDFNAPECSILLWALVKLKIQPSNKVLEGIQDRICAEPDELGPTSLSKLLWCFAKLRIMPNAAATAVLSSKVLDTVDDFGPHAISNVLWAYAVLKQEHRHAPPERMVRAMGQRAFATMSQFNPQSLSTLVHSHAKLRLQPSAPLLRAAIARAEEIAPEFQPNDTAMLMWALAKLHADVEPSLIRALAARASDIMTQFKPQELANLLWACAMLDAPPGETLLRIAEEQASHRIEAYTPQALSNLVWALAKLGTQPGAALVAAVWGQARRTCDRFEPRSISLLLWSFARLGVQPDRPALDALVTRAEAQLDRFDPDDQANLAWAVKQLRSRAVVGRQGVAAGGGGGGQPWAGADNRPR